MLFVRRTAIRSAALVAIATLSTAVLVACSGSGTSGGNGAAQRNRAVARREDPVQPPAYSTNENIRDGGALTTSLPEISPQFNTFHIDGTSYTLAVWRWYNPILITFTPDGQAVFNPDYLTDVKPETVDGKHQDHLHDQPEGHVQRRLADRLAVVRVDLEDQQRHGHGLSRGLHRRLRPDHVGRPRRRRPAGRGDVPGYQSVVAATVQCPAEPEGRGPGRVQPGVRHESAQRMGRGPLPGAEVRPAERRHRVRAQPEAGRAGRASWTPGPS